MNVPMHPMLVHLPMALAALMPLVAGGALLGWRFGWWPRRTWSLVCALQLALLVGSLLSMKSGEDEEDRVERVVAESLIEHHEHAAKRFTWGAGIVFVISLLPLVLRDGRPARIAAGVTLLGTLAVGGLGYFVGSAGGELVYQHGAANAYVGSPPAKAGEDRRRRRGQDDDDHR